MHSVLSRLRPIARHWYHRADNPDVRAARRFLKRLRSDPPDVLYLGDSTTMWISPDDTDRRNLGQIVSDGLGDGITIHVIAGAGYTAKMQLAHLRLLEAHKSRPLVLHPLWIRGYFTAWAKHPVYGYEAALAKINSLDPHGPAWRAWASFPRPTPEDFERHGEIPHPTLLGDWQVKDYAEPLRHRIGLSEREYARLIHAFHDGQRLALGSPELEPLVRFGRRLDELGLRTVAYHNPLAIETGVALLGPEFAEVTGSNRAVLEQAYLADRAGRPPILQTGHVFAPDEFVDPNIADSHLNQRGRVRLAQMIVCAVRAALRPSLSGEREDLATARTAGG